MKELSNMEIPLPIQKESDIYSYGFDESLNRSSDVSLNPDFSTSEMQNEVYNALGLAGINVKGSQQGNFFAGYQAGANTIASNLIGIDNTFIGYKAGEENRIGRKNVYIGYSSGINNNGQYNIFIGAEAGYDSIDSSYNMLIGYEAGKHTTTATFNTIIGQASGYSLTSGSRNTFIGYQSGQNITFGEYNTIIGRLAGANNITGSNNIFIGDSAGYFETGSSKLFIDNISRASEADGRIKALIYGVFDAVTANQKLTINGLLNQSVSKTPANAGDTGTAGDICWDANYIYVCTATNTWKRAGIATW